MGKGGRGGSGERGLGKEWGRGAGEGVGGRAPPSPPEPVVPAPLSKEGKFSYESAVRIKHLAIERFYKSVKIFVSRGEASLTAKNVEKTMTIDSSSKGGMGVGGPIPDWTGYIVHFIPMSITGTLM